MSQWHRPMANGMWWCLVAALPGRPGTPRPSPLPALPLPPHLAAALVAGPQAELTRARPATWWPDGCCAWKKTAAPGPAGCAQACQRKMLNECGRTRAELRVAEGVLGSSWHTSPGAHPTPSPNHRLEPSFPPHPLAPSASGFIAAPGCLACPAAVWGGGAAAL